MENVKTLLRPFLVYSNIYGIFGLPIVLCKKHHFKYFLFINIAGFCCFIFFKHAIFSLLTQFYWVCYYLVVAGCRINLCSTKFLG